MPINSKKKGASGEREFSQFLIENFSIPARRGQQFSGGTDSPDVVTPYDIHFEVKRTNSLQIYAAIDQAVKDSQDIKVPIVASRRDRGEWLLHFKAKDLKKLLEALSVLLKKETIEKV